MNSRQQAKLTHAVRKLLRKEHSLETDVERRENQQSATQAETKSQDHPKETLPTTKPLIKKEHRQTKEATPKKRFWRDYEPTERFNCIIAASTTVYMVTTLFMYVTAKQELKVSHRAFIYAEDPFLIGDGGIPGVPDKRPAFLTINLHNSGDTPARKALVDTNYCVTSGVMPNNFSFPTSLNKQPQLLLPPKEYGQTSFQLPNSILADIEKEAKKLTVYGTVSYEDVFDEWHRTDFCVEYRGFVMKPDNTSVEKLVWSACPIHNCHDGDCPKKYGDAPCPEAN